jgi:hypothetical protein
MKIGARHLMAFRTNKTYRSTSRPPFSPRIKHVVCTRSDEKMIGVNAQWRITMVARVEFRRHDYSASHQG